MKITDETAQQQRSRGFWARLKNPRTLSIVFWCVRIIERLIRIYFGDGFGPDD